MRVRPATRDDLAAVMGVLDAAMLEVDAATVERWIDAGDEGAVLVAVEDSRVLAACALDAHEAAHPDARDGTAHVDAIAVRRRRRDQGVGSALVEAAADRWSRLTAEFDADLRPFYESLGFEVEPVGDGRYRGVRE